MPTKCETTTPAKPVKRLVPRLVQPIGSEPSKTKQEFKDDCDINRILAKYQRTGALSHYAKYAATYGDFSSCDYQTAQNTILRAEKMFAELPSSIRNLVATPNGFLDFVQNPANAEKMRELGLTNTPSSPIVPPPADSKPPSDPVK